MNSPSGRASPAPNRNPPVTRPRLPSTSRSNSPERSHSIHLLTIALGDGSMMGETNPARQIASQTIKSRIGMAIPRSSDLNRAGTIT